MTAFIATPAPRRSRHGNRITALRWAKRLRELGWHVRVEEAWCGEACDLLVALHARRSHPSIARHVAMRPGQPRVVALTGTDVYGDLQEDALARSSIESATRLVVLQPLALGRLSDRMRTKTHVIRQSARPPRAPHRIVAGELFAACVVAHLREVKDPMLAAHAVRCLPSRSRVRVLHLGAALDEQWRMRAEDAVRFTGGRWRWLGDRPRGEALRILAGTELLVLTSVQEGGANVVTEAIACGVPVLSTRIDGSLGILGAEYPGYFDVGDATALAELLARCETDPDFLATLRARCEVLRPLVDPAVERASWRRLLGELGWETRNDQG